MRLLVAALLVTTVLAIAAPPVDAMGYCTVARQPCPGVACLDHDGTRPGYDTCVGSVRCLTEMDVACPPPQR